MRLPLAGCLHVTTRPRSSCHAATLSMSSVTSGMPLHPAPCKSTYRIYSASAHRPTQLRSSACRRLPRRCVLLTWNALASMCCSCRVAIKPNDRVQIPRQRIRCNAMQLWMRGIPCAGISSKCPVEGRGFRVQRLLALHALRQCRLHCLCVATLQLYAAMRRDTSRVARRCLKGPAKSWCSASCLVATPPMCHVGRRICKTAARSLL